MKHNKKTNSKKTAKNTYMDLTLDGVFKAYFKDAKQVCISLLRQFLPFPKGSDIEDLKYLDSVLNPQNPEDKKFSSGFKSKAEYRCLCQHRDANCFQTTL